MDSFNWTVRVYFEDTDSGGVVYYANYLKFMERARTEWLRSLGCEQDELARRHDLMFMVRSASLDYYRPARFNDLLTIYSCVRQLRHVSLNFEQTVHKQHKPEEILCRGQIRIACVAVTTLRPRRLPAVLLGKLTAMEKMTCR